MPIGDNAVFTNPIIIEEQFQMTGLDIQNPFREKAYQIAQLPLQTGILPHAEKIGIRLEYADGYSSSCARSHPWR